MKCRCVMSPSARWRWRKQKRSVFISPLRGRGQHWHMHLAHKGFDDCGRNRSGNNVQTAARSTAVSELVRFNLLRRAAALHAVNPQFVLQAHVTGRRSGRRSSPNVGASPSACDSVLHDAGLPSSIAGRQPCCSTCATDSDLWDAAWPVGAAPSWSIGPRAV